MLLHSGSAFAGADSEQLSKGNSPTSAEECFEGVSRAMFKFNHALDKAIFKPVAKGYRALPVPIRKGTGNAVDNLRSLLTLSNHVLQGDFREAGTTAGRFAINTTVGILGIFDPATKMGLNDYDKEDYGQTLGSWGFGEGCYVVLPVLGPSTARDAIASIANFTGGDAWYNITVRNDTHYVSDFDYYFSRGSTGVDFLAKNLGALENLEENSIDFYASVKSLYLQERKQQIANADVITETFDDSDWEEIETQ